MICCLNSTQNVSFEGFKENFKVGEAVCRKFKKEFPILRSNTLIESKILQYEGLDRFEKIRPRVEELAMKHNLGVFQVRMETRGNYISRSSYVKKLKKVIADKKYANCMEQSHIIQHELLNRGEKAHVVVMRLRDAASGLKIKGKNHAFSVLGLKNGAKITEPKTWGRNAVTVDSWANKVASPAEAVDTYKTMLGFDPAKHTISYELGTL